jgi:hypothetical protein
MELNVENYPHDARHIYASPHDARHISALATM